MDSNLTHWINSFAGQFPVVDTIVVAITIAGLYVLVGLVAIRWWARRDRTAERNLAIRCALASATGVVFNQVILLFVHRTRPYDLGITRLIIERSTDPSFPSDHATVAFAVMISLLLSRAIGRIPLTTLAILVCLSRVFVGTHFVTDIIGGAFVGTVAAVAVDRLYPRLDSVTERLVKIL